MQKYFTALFGNLTITGKRNNRPVCRGYTLLVILAVTYVISSFAELEWVNCGICYVKITVNISLWHEREEI